MEMHQVRYFLAAAEELNFTRAAQKCHVAQPSMTRAIRQLEEELGGALFHRERANTHMTELGRVMKPHLEQLWRMTKATRGLADDVLGLKKATLKLGVMCTITPEAIVGMLKAMHANHPSVQIDILDDAAAALTRRLLLGELDAAIVCMEGKQDNKLHALPVFKEQMKIVVSPRHKLAGQDAIVIQDLNGERYLERLNCEIASRIGQMFDEQGFDDETICRSERDDWIVEMAAAGFGYACMPGSSIHHAGVVARPLVDPEIWRKIHLVTVRGRPHSPAVGALVQEVMATEWLGKKALARKRAAELPDYDLD
jgi:LysR family transcriptional regulator, hydrogen peroxide-inducible genes activator